MILLVTLVLEYWSNVSITLLFVHLEERSDSLIRNGEQYLRVI